MVLDLQLFIFHWGLDVVLWQGISLPQSQIFQRQGLHNPIGGLFLKDSVLGGVFFVWLFLLFMQSCGGSYSLCGENAISCAPTNFKPKYVTGKAKY